MHDRATLRPIGIAAYNDIDHRNGVADYSIVIGEADFRLARLRTEATRLMLDTPLHRAGPQRDHAEPFEYNLAAARLREGRFPPGRPAATGAYGRRPPGDIIYMDCLAGEFESPVLGKIVAPDIPR
jgi:hypothetical protein